MKPLLAKLELGFNFEPLISAGIQTSSFSLPMVFVKAFVAFLMNEKIMFQIIQKWTVSVQNLIISTLLCPHKDLKVCSNYKCSFGQKTNLRFCSALGGTLVWI